MKIGIDFDNTLIKHKRIPTSRNGFDDKPMKYAVDAVKHLLKHRHQLYILTSRYNNEWVKIHDWLKKWGFPELEVTNIKKHRTSLIIDDRAIRFTNWPDVCRYLA